MPSLAFSQGTPTLPDSLVLRTVVIQATRAETKSAVPHTNFDARQIARTNQAQDIPYLLSSIPSLVETSDAGTGVGYTGMRIRGSDPTRINVTINGIPLNDAESQGVYWVDLPDLAAAAAEIQVQRGVGASTNGSGAFGATVNLDLARVSAEPFAILTNTYGSFGTHKHAAYLGTGLLGGKVAFTGRLTQLASDGYVDRGSANLQSYHLSGTYLDDRQSLQAHILSGREITYQAWNGLPAQYLEVDSLRTYNSAGTEKPGDPYADEVDHYTQRHYLLHYKRLLGPNWQVQLNGHYTRGFGYYEQYKAAQAFADYQLPVFVLGDSTVERTDLIRRLWLDNYFYGGTFALHWKPSLNPPALTTAPSFLLGGALSRYSGGHYGEIVWAGYGIPKDFRYYDNDADKWDGNVFGKIDVTFRKNIALSIDLQYRQVEYRFLGFDREQNNVSQSVYLYFFNPKAGITWAFLPDWTASAFFGVGQREPNRDDYTQSTPSSRPRPEKLYDWEAGLKRSGDNWKLSLNGFAMFYRDQLVLDGRINDVGAYIRTNVPRSYRAGVEMEAAVRLLVPRISLEGNLAISRNKVSAFIEYRDNWDTGEQEQIAYRSTDLAFSPNWVARGAVHWSVLPPVSKQQLGFTLTGKYVGRQFLDNTANPATDLPAYFFTDLRVNYDLLAVIGKEINLILAVNNLFNTRYSSNGWVYRYVSQGYDDRPYNPYTQLESNGVYHQAGYFPQAGRNFMGTLTLQF